MFVELGISLFFETWEGRGNSQGNENCPKGYLLAFFGVLFFKAGKKKNPPAFLSFSYISKEISLHYSNINGQIR